MPRRRRGPPAPPTPPRPTPEPAPERRVDDKSTHILSASSTLLGLCFVVLTSLRALDLRGKTIIDELTAIAMVLFMSASILSFLSIRSRTSLGARFERVADNVFLIGLCLLFATTMLITFNVVE